MCDYCINLLSPIKTAKLPILDAELDMGALGKAKMSMYIKQYERGTYLDLNIDNYGLGGRTVRKLCSLDYCPKCGAKISDEEEQSI